MILTQEPNSPPAPWHQASVAETLSRLETRPDVGLDDAEAQRRLAVAGPNELVDRGARSPWRILLDQLTGVLTIILILSAAVSLVLKDYEDAAAILAIVILNTILGFTQENRAEKAMAALKRMSVPRVRVRREGRIQEISAGTLVPGDVVLLEVGNTVPADGRLVESATLRAQEAVLTGESEPVEKQVQPLLLDNPPLGDQTNRVFMGTAVSYGRGLAVITETGMRTELGKIAGMLQDVVKEATPLQRRLGQVGKSMAYAALVIVAIVFLLGVLRGEELRLMFLTAISMAVAAVPEGLQTVVTIALALGAQRMLKRHALIRKLPAVETLGSVTVICSDKTGTLTENRMTVTTLEVAGCQVSLTAGPSAAPFPQADRPSLHLLLASAALCNDAALQPSGQTQGDPTETALVSAAWQQGLDKNELERGLPRVSELPFDSDRKRMTTLHRPDPAQPAPADLAPLLAAGPLLGLTKGAVDSLLEVCSQVWVGDHAEGLDEEWRGRIRSGNDRLAQNGMRVLGSAFRFHPEIPASPTPEALERELIFIGLAGMIDPARTEAAESVRTARIAGIRPVMITGDHPLTAVAIARKLGIAAEGGRVVTGQELARMSVADLETQVDTISVYARVSPEHKLKIVQALQNKGHIVAMTGDGVNDAPALKQADIGVAMGQAGTDVAKEAAEMVLLDDNFATIVSAVEEGRRIYANIRKFLKYALASNTGELWVMLAAPFLGMPLPLLPLQILWVNLVTDGLPGLALTLEPADTESMRRKPYHPQENIFSRGLGIDILWIGLVLGLAALGMGFWAWRSGDEHWQTMVFTTLTLSQMGNVLALRSDSQTLWKLGLFSNKPLLGSVLLTIALQLAVVYVPFLQQVFNTRPLPPLDLAISLGVSAVVFFAVELSKWVRGRLGK